MNYDALVCIFKEPNKKEEKRKRLSDHFVVQFQKNHVIRELFVRDRSIYNQLSNILRTKCILTTFHTEFTVVKGIGKGSFAKVCLFFFFSSNIGFIL
jgi:hypothetical protein